MLDMAAVALLASILLDLCCVRFYEVECGMAGFGGGEEWRSSRAPSVVCCGIFSHTVSVTSQIMVHFFFFVCLPVVQCKHKNENTQEI